MVEWLAIDVLEKDGCGALNVVSPKFLRGTYENQKISQNVRCCGLYPKRVLAD
jgi:hypothetical protein